MKHTNYIPLLAMLSLSALAVVPVTAHAQSKLPRVSIHLRDRPTRAALERIFTDAGIQYAIDPRVSGYVTLKIRNQPFENALKLIMRSSTVPLTYTRENNIYIVRPLQTAPVISNTPDIAPEGEEQQPGANTVLPFNYFDPYYFAMPAPRAPIIMGGPGMGGPGINNLGGFGAGGINGYIGGSFLGMGLFGNPYLGGFNSFGGLNGVNFGGNLGGGVPGSVIYGGFGNMGGRGF